MGKKIFIVFLACFFPAIFIFFSSFTLQKPQFSNYKVLKIGLGKGNFKLYVADDDKKRESGLSSVNILNPNEGMIFIFESKARHIFWMKDMKFSLDFIFVEEAKVVDIITSVRPETYPENIQSKFDSDKIIELPAGAVEKYKIKIGDVIKYD